MRAARPALLTSSAKPIASEVDTELASTPNCRQLSHLCVSLDNSERSAVPKPVRPIWLYEADGARCGGRIGYGHVLCDMPIRRTYPRHHVGKTRFRVRIEWVPGLFLAARRADGLDCKLSRVPRAVNGASFGNARALGWEAAGVMRHVRFSWP